jgi:outer membrane protein TolC
MIKESTSLRYKSLIACLSGLITALILVITMPSNAFSIEEETINGPLRLEDCLNIAFENNLDLSQAKKGREEAAFRLKQAEGRRYPEVGIGAMSGYMSDVNKMRIGDITVEGPAGIGPLTVPGKNITVGEHEKTDLFVALLQPIYTGGKIKGGIRAASAGYEGSNQQLALVKSQVRQQVINAFYQLTKARELKRIAIASREQIESHLKDAKNLMDQGMMLKSEMLPVDLRRLDMELKIVQADNAAARATASLAERMGLPPDKALDISKDPEPPPPWPIPDALANSTVKRPEQQISEKQIEAAAGEIDIAGAELLPQVGLTASGHYGWPGFIATQPDWEPWWQTGVQLSWNVFDMDQRKNEKNAAQAKKSRLEEARAAVDQMIALDRINTRLAYGEACRKILISKEKVISAQENFKTKEDNFKVGMATNTDYLDAHTELLNATSELALISAEVQPAWEDYVRAGGVEDHPMAISKETP